MNTCPFCDTEYEREGYCKAFSCAIRLVQFNPQEIDQIRRKFATQAAKIERLTAALRLRHLNQCDGSDSLDVWTRSANLRLKQSGALIAGRSSTGRKHTETHSP